MLVNSGEGVEEVALWGSVCGRGRCRWEFNLCNYFILVDCNVY